MDAKDQKIKAEALGGRGESKSKGTGGKVTQQWKDYDGCKYCRPNARLEQEGIQNVQIKACQTAGTMGTVV